LGRREYLSISGFRFHVDLFWTFVEYRAGIDVILADCAACQIYGKLVEPLEVIIFCKILKDQSQTNLVTC